LHFEKSMPQNEKTKMRMMSSTTPPITKPIFRFFMHIARFNAVELFLNLNACIEERAFNSRRQRTAPSHVLIQAVGLVDEQFNFLTAL
jgi:hypothetical protein